jgi:hypothetical protein
MPEYPVFKSPEGEEHTCIFHSIMPGIFWEHYGFKQSHSDPDIYYGYVMGDYEEWGNFSRKELEENNAMITTDPDVLHTIMVPPGWTRK